VNYYKFATDVISIINTYYVCTGFFLYLATTGCYFPSADVMYLRAYLCDCPHAWQLIVVT